MATVFPPVIVEWLDILDENGWSSSPPEPLKPVRVTTAGFLIQRDKEHVTIIRDYHHADGEDSPVYGGRVVIPASVVRAITFLVPKKGKSK